jgi:hypothetical protein
MRLTYDLVSRTLVALDPFRWTWGCRAPSPPRGTAALQRKLSQLRERAQAHHAGRGMADVAHLLRSVDPSRPFRVFPDVPPLDGRHPIVLAHGPSLHVVLPAIAAHRDRLYVVAPFRTALRLAEANVWADAVVLVDAAPQTSEFSVRAWQSVPVSHRRELERRSTLVMEPLAPAVIHAGFSRACVFDDGLGWLPPSAALPCWGSALLPSMCLPLALGAPTVAVGGMDMGATFGRAARTWSGRQMRVDPKLAVAHGLLEAVGTALPGRLIDLSGDSVFKRGFELQDIAGLLGRPAARSVARAAPQVTVRAGQVLRHVLAVADAFGETVKEMTTHAARVCALLDTEDRSSELHSLIETMEYEWAREPRCRAALSLLQPPYLRAMWQLRDAGFRSRNPLVSATMKGRLIGPEIAGLETAYREWLAVIRTAAQGSGGERVGTGQCPISNIQFPIP